jgi:hypothetical protein
VALSFYRITYSPPLLGALTSTDNNDRENETDDVEEEEIRQFYTHLNKEDKVLLVKLLRRNKVRHFSG